MEILQHHHQVSFVYLIDLRSLCRVLGLVFAHVQVDKFIGAQAAVAVVRNVLVQEIRLGCLCKFELIVYASLLLEVILFGEVVTLQLRSLIVPHGSHLTGLFVAHLLRSHQKEVKFEL